VDRASLEFHTPLDVTVPPLVQDFYDWVEERENGSIGYFDLEGDRRRSSFSGAKERSVCSADRPPRFSRSSRALRRRKPISTKR
jgi:hypothetical protein